MKTQFEMLAEKCLEGVTNLEDAVEALQAGFRALVTKLVNEGVITLEADTAPIELSEEELNEQLGRCPDGCCDVAE